MKNKFTDRNPDAKRSTTAIANKLEIIACGIADELISGTQVLRGNLDIQDKVKILDSLRNYYATVNKLDAPEHAGGAFDNFRKQIANGGGGGDLPSGDAGGESDGSRRRAGTAARGVTVIPLHGSSRDEDDEDGADGNSEDAGSRYEPGARAS